MSGDIDSRVSDPNDFESDSPGANDNATGMAGTIEAARVLSKYKFESSIIYVGLSGEEQGLYGGQGLAGHAKKNNWNIVQDVSTKNYSYVPLLTMAGYSIMIKEISKQTTHYITHIFLQAGVGGMAAGVVAGVAKYFKRIPKIIIVEPDGADCVLQSIKSKSLKKIKIKKESIMGGMSCNEMSLIPWHVLKKASDCCVTVNDSKVPKTVAMLKDKKLSKRSIIGGECATPGIISLISLCNNPKTKKLINLNEKSNVLVIGCEGNADVKLYKQLLSKGRK